MEKVLRPGLSEGEDNRQIPSNEVGYCGSYILEYLLGAGMSKWLLEVDGGKVLSKKDD